MLVMVHAVSDVRVIFRGGYEGWVMYRVSALCAYFRLNRSAVKYVVVSSIAEPLTIWAVSLINRQYWLPNSIIYA